MTKRNDFENSSAYRLTGNPWRQIVRLPQRAKRRVEEGNPRDIRKGAIPILFTSPEAALGILRGPLFDAAQQGRLRFFVMDEAHVVSQWGQQFRPEFQSIAGLRESLLEACPADGRFRTLLLTGTLAPESLQTLQQLFGGEECQIVAEPFLRCEPGFLVDCANSEEQRHQRVLEAIRHLPRPIILYTTLRDHAFEWLSILQSSGFRRVRLVRGEISPAPRASNSFGTGILARSTSWSRRRPLV